MSARKTNKTNKTNKNTTYKRRNTDASKTLIEKERKKLLAAVRAKVKRKLQVPAISPKSGRGDKTDRWDHRTSDRLLRPEVSSADPIAERVMEYNKNRATRPAGTPRPEQVPSLTPAPAKPRYQPRVSVEASMLAKLSTLLYDMQMNARSIPRKHVFNVYMPTSVLREFLDVLVRAAIQNKPRRTPELVHAIGFTLRYRVVPYNSQHEGWRAYTKRMGVWASQFTDIVCVSYDYNYRAEFTAIFANKKRLYKKLFIVEYKEGE